MSAKIMPAAAPRERRSGPAPRWPSYSAERVLRRSGRRRHESLPTWGDPAPRRVDLGAVAFWVAFAAYWCLLAHIAMNGGLR